MIESERLWNLAAMERNPDDRRHGTYAGYMTYKCRCLACRMFWNEKAREYRHRAKTRPVPPEKHGTSTGYNYYGCRCPACAAVEASRARNRNQASRWVHEKRRRQRMATNKTIVEGVLGKYVGDDREEVRKLMLKVAALARTDEREVTMKKLREKREWVSQSEVNGKVERFKKQWTLKAIDSLTSVI